MTVAWMYVLSTIAWVLWIKVFYRTGESVALTDHGVAGWVALIVLDVLDICPAVLGGLLAVRALRSGAGTGARVGLALNGALVLLSVVLAVVSVIPYW